jgi:DNA-binding response OmpR family regulator
MKKIASHARYDLLLLDYELSGMNGIQLVQQARSLAHRRTIPILILSAVLDEASALTAGADALLRKPEDISAVAETVARLLRSAKH